MQWENAIELEDLLREDYRDTLWKCNLCIVTWMVIACARVLITKQVHRSFTQVFGGWEGSIISSICVQDEYLPGSRSARSYRTFSDLMPSVSITILKVYTELPSCSFRVLCGIHDSRKLRKSRRHHSGHSTSGTCDS